MVSLILATYGRAEEMGRLVDSLLAQTDRGFELVVVDQNPDERLANHIERARNGGLDVTHVRMEKPGLSEARNRGITLAKYPVIAFPDDDCWYEAGTIAAVRKGLDSVSGMGGLIACWVEQSAAVCPGEAYWLDYEAWHNFRGGYASSISLFLERALFDTIGGFDQRFGVGKWYGAAEETDLILRALAAGARLHYNPLVRVHHAWSDVLVGSFADLARNARQRSRGTGAIYAKHKMSFMVVLRGFVSPVLKALARPTRPARLVLSLFTSLGRVEGYLRWKRES